MKAKDVMTTRVVSVAPEDSVRDIASRLLMCRISAVPVVDTRGAVIGIVSEGDLVRRVETGTSDRHRPWWLGLLADEGRLAGDYVKSHGRKARDVMSTDVISVQPDTPLAEIAELIESKQIKRVPVLDKGKLVGIVSRADLLHGLAAMRAVEPVQTPSDESIREQIVAELDREPWGHTLTTSVLVTNGIVEFWGISNSEPEQEASRVVAENVSGVREVVDHRTVTPLVGS
jgi:CBS domain-containing protein